MSAVQVQTRVKACTTLDQAVQVRQSLQIAQASLGISIGCIAFLRYLLPEECFAERYYGGSSSAIYSYEDLKNDTSVDDKSKGRSKFQILKRGCSGEVDQLLDWIELGIFDALEKNFLAAVQFAIFTDRSKLEEIAESYTFSFRYQGSVKDGTRGIAGMDISSDSGVPMTLKDSRSNLNKFLRHLCTVASLLPDLPDERYLTIRLYYTDDCPMDYEPKGFKKCDSGPLYFSETKEVKVQRSRIEVKAGHHDVSLKVANVDVLARSHDLACTAKVMADFDNEMTVNAQSGASAVSAERRPVLSASPSDSTGNVNQQSHQSNSRSVAEEDESMIDTVDTQNTEVRRDTVQKAELRNMLVPQSQSSNVMDTQEQEFSSQVAQQGLQNLSLHVRTLPRELQHQGHLNGGDGDSLNAYPDIERQGLLDRDTNARMQISVAKLAQLSARKTRNIGEDSPKTSCECGIVKEDKDMLRCVNCGHRQHLHCYGFHSNEDARIPDPHACYSCLLDGEEAHILGDLSRDCMLRRALKILHKNGEYPVADTQFAHLLGCPVAEAREVTSHLKQGGFLIPINLKKRSTGVRKFKLVTTEAQIGQMQRQYFDPLARIAHHYEVRKMVHALPQSMMDSMLLPEAPSDSVLSSIESTGDTGIADTSLYGTQNQVEATEDEETDELVPTTPMKKGPWFSGMASSTASETNTPACSRRSSRLKKQTRNPTTSETQSAIKIAKRKNAAGEFAPSKRTRASQIDTDYFPVNG